MAGASVLHKRGKAQRLGVGHHRVMQQNNRGFDRDIEAHLGVVIRWVVMSLSRPDEHHKQWLNRLWPDPRLHCEAHFVATLRRLHLVDLRFVGAIAPRNKFGMQAPEPDQLPHTTAVERSSLRGRRLGPTQERQSAASGCRASPCDAAEQPRLRRFVD